MSHDLEDCVAFLRHLIQVPSLPGEEGDLARHVSEKLTTLGFVDVGIDAVGNVSGWIRGRGAAPPVLFNTHLDHVDTGDPSRWPRPPFAGDLSDGTVWGRGAVDIKGPLAAQVFGVARLLAEPAPPPGDVGISCVVQEEIGGVGSRHLGAELPATLIVVGEPSRNQIRRGHRGRAEILLEVQGRSVHASVPEKGINPLLTMGHFLVGLEGVEHPEHPELGRSTIAPTLLSTDQASHNVIPGEARLVLDWRSVPDDSEADVLARLDRLAAASLSQGASYSLTVPEVERRCWTGAVRTIPISNPSYLLAEDHPAIAAAMAIVGEALSQPPSSSVWQFATDGGHFAAAGGIPIGFGPGNELLAHTVNEHIEVSALEEAMAANERLARELGRRFVDGGGVP